MPITTARIGLSMVSKLKCVPTLAGGRGVVRVYYLDSGIFGMITLAMPTRSAKIVVVIVSLLVSFSKALAALES